ncbi:hypothetical protein GCM10009682_33010 [Luedemannella flava]|uniref:Endoglucanase n=1 Tax=Luedemannella flava TaxID=349316 RepID=A0ABN2M3V6_9ACTN
MKKRLALAAVAGLALAASIVVTAWPAQAAVGLRISGGKLVEANGTPFIMRGVNHAHTWYQSQTATSLANIKAAGANSVRVVLASGQRWTKNDTSDVANVISQCKANKLICILEVHDTTGYGEQSGAATLSQAVDYWISVQSALTGQENYVILNIGNEPYGNQGYGTWASDNVTAVQRLRNAGFQHTIMIDAPNWGQDWSFTMRDNASTVWNADTQKNLLFSIHMYGVFDTAAEVSDYLNRFVSAGLPIAVGEFGDMHSDGNPDEDAILSTTQALGLGYLGWSWSGNGGGVEYLDMVTNFSTTFTSWGNRLFNGTNGIKATAKEATIYGGVQPTSAVVTTRGATTRPPTSAVVTSRPPTSAVVSSRPPTSSVVTTRPPTSGPTGTKSCTATYSIVGSWPGGFQGNVKVTAGSSAISGWTVTWTFANGQTVTQSWSSTITTSGATVTAKNAAWNGSLGAGGSTEFGFIGSWTGSNTAPTASCTAA